MTAKGPGSEEVPSSRAGATGACFPSESCLFIPPQGQLALGLTPWLPELLRGAVTFSAKARRAPTKRVGSFIKRWGNGRHSLASLLPFASQLLSYIPAPHLSIKEHFPSLPVLFSFSNSTCSLSPTEIPSFHRKPFCVD